MTSILTTPFLGGLLGGASNQLGPTGRSSAGRRTGLGFKIHDGLEDAIRVTLGRSGRSGVTGQAKISQAEQDLEDAQQPSYVKGLFDQLGNITSGLRSITEKLSQVQAGTDQYEELQKQYTSLTADYARITTNSDFQHLLKINKQIVDILNSGARSEDVYRALQPEFGFLGADYINRVRYGDIAQLSKFSENISKLAAITQQDIANSPDILDTIDEAVAAASTSLVGPKIESHETKSEQKKVAAVAKERPKLASISFQSNQGLSIELNTYIGTDAIQAALAHMPLDPKNVIRLVFDPGDHKEKDKFKEHEQRKRDEQLSRINVEDPIKPNANHPASETELKQIEPSTARE